MPSFYLQGVRPHAVDPIYHPRVERSCAECVPRGAFQDDAPKGRRGSGTGHGDGLRFRPFVLPQTVQLVSGPIWAYLRLSVLISA